MEGKNRKKTVSEGRKCVFFRIPAGEKGEKNRKNRKNTLTFANSFAKIDQPHRRGF